MVNKITLNEKELLTELVDQFGKSVTRSELVEYCDGKNYVLPRWLMKDQNRRLERGVYSLETATKKKETKKATKPKAVVAAKTTSGLESLDGVKEDLVPDVNKLYVPFGHFKDVKSVVEAKMFYPVFVTGLSGNGKTFMIEQICAKLKRECFRVNITGETDEDDLLGGFRLINGETKWFDGPVVRAMKRGGVLLLDEVDLATPKIMCLQPILEGKGVLLKKINKFIKPAEGFNIIATANTKGKGSEDGQFIGTQILNEAFLERFPLTFEQKYPTAKTETKILGGIFSAGNYDKTETDEFTDHLIKWAQQIRKTYDDDGCTEIITTRRLCHIANAFLIFGDRKKSVKMCVARFDQETQSEFMRLYDSLDPVYIREQEEKKKAEQEELDKLAKEQDVNLSSIFSTTA
jgi:hypothetical protein